MLRDGTDIEDSVGRSKGLWVPAVDLFIISCCR